jgi:hypothetical protein
VTVATPLIEDDGVRKTDAGAVTDATAEEDDEPTTNRLDTATTLATPLRLAEVVCTVPPPVAPNERRNQRKYE